MNQEELKRAFRDATAAPPAFSRERVWNDLARAPRPTRWRLGLALMASMLLGGLVTLQLLPRQRAGQWHEGPASVVWTSARVDRAARHFTLHSGALAVSTWGSPVEVQAGAHVVQVERGLAVVRVAGESVTAELVQGALLFDSEERTAPLVAPSPLSDAAARLDEPSTAPLKLAARAAQAETEQRFEDAARSWAELAASGSLDAEVANFKQGELELRQLHRPEAALRTFAAGQARFARGALTQERQLSTLESQVALGRWADVEAGTTAFLAQHPQSERADELRLLHGRALWEVGQRARACAEAPALSQCQ